MQEQQKYTYKFEEGINYFKGPNDSGKTEFYTFIDYMFGASKNFQGMNWYEGTLDHADLAFEKDSVKIIVSRYLSNLDKNYFRYVDEPPGEAIRKDEYKSRLNAIFTTNLEALKDLRTFVEEDIGYRTFTLFNFLGENRQGILQDFFEKSDELKYALKLPELMNYIFNKNILEIKKLKKEEHNLKEKQKILEKTIIKNEDIKDNVNHQLEILGIKIFFQGSNSTDVLCAISQLQNEVEKLETAGKSRTISELEVVYTSLDEQIKRQSNKKYDYKVFEENNEKQEKLFIQLQDLLQLNKPYSYLLEPIMYLTNDLQKSISFNKYLIQENAIKELKKQRDKIKDQIVSNKTRFTIYTVSDKMRAIMLINEYLNAYDKVFDQEEINVIKHELRVVREQIRILQNSNDIDKLRVLSNDITALYKLSTEISTLAKFDFQKNGFCIEYIKKGNILQPKILDKNKSEDEQLENYYTGSNARHTLIQLCGYLAFLKLLILEDKYPIIPILIIDHISKPFDIENEMAIGEVLQGIYKELSLSDFQVIMFDDKDPEELGLSPNRITLLVEANKSGFNPFYYKE